MELELHKFNTFKIYQPKNGYRFAAEPFVLVHGLKNIRSKVFVDFGSGCGIIAILLAKNNPDSCILAVESNKDMTEIIKRNIEINELSNISILSSLEDIRANSIDFFITNPPYFKDDAYRISKKFKREKFEKLGFLEMMIKTANKTLKNKGNIRISYHPTRFVELLDILRNNNFGLKTILPVYGDYNKKASFLIVDAMLSGKDYVEFLPPIFLKKDMTWLVM